MPKLSKNQILIVLSLILTVFVFYLWRASISGPLFSPTTTYFSYYDLLGEAFLKGQFHLPIEVPDELLALEDPYDPVANKKFRYSGIADIAFYKGKFYLYFGAIPAFVLYMPIYWLTKLRISDGFAISIFMWGSVIWTALLILYLRNKYFYTVPIWMIYISILLLGFVNLGPYLAKKAILHAVPISCGIFFLSGAIYMLCTAFSNNLNLKKIVLASIFLGLAVMSRPNFCIVSIILIIFILFKLISNYNHTPIAYRLSALILPFLICIGFLAYYNYARFENISEFGLKYQLTTVNSFHHSLPLLSLERLGLRINKYFLTFPIITKDFPFIYFNSHLTSPQASLNFSSLREDLVGLIPCYPFILLLLLVPLISWLHVNKHKFTFTNLSYFKFEMIILLLIIVFDLYALKRYGSPAIPFIPIITGYCLLFIFFPLLFWRQNRNNSFFKLEFCIIYFAAFINCLFLLLWGHITYRYLADVTVSLILFCLCLWLYCDYSLPSNFIGKPFLRIFGTLAAVISIFTGFALSY